MSTEAQKPIESTEAEEKKLPVKTPDPIALVEGAAVPKTVEQEVRLAKLYIDGKMVPERFHEPLQLVAAIHFTRQLFPKTWMVALKSVAMIKGSPSLFGDLPLAKVQESGTLFSKEEYILDKDYKKICEENKNLSAEPWAAICKTVRVDGENKYELETFFTMDEARKAGLLGNKDMPWAKYPKYMLKYRARSQNLKDNFADCLNGVAIAEYDFNAFVNQAGVVEAEVMPNAAEELNKKYLKAPQDQEPKVVGRNQKGAVRSVQEGAAE